MPGDDGLEGAPSLPCAQFVPLALIFPDIGVAALVGQIKFGASVSYTGSQAKTVDWQQTLSAMGTTSFTGVGTTNNNGIGTNSSVGNYNLSNAYQIVYRQDNGAVYSRSSYNIYAKEQVTGDATSAIRFKVQFFDGRPNNLTYGIDELAYGDWYSTIQTAYAESTAFVSRGTIKNIENLEFDKLPPYPMNESFISQYLNEVRNYKKN
mgnify:CR=1 FL=1